MEGILSIKIVNKNKYYYRLEIYECKFHGLVHCFLLDFTASDTARLTDISIRAVNAICLK